MSVYSRTCPPGRGRASWPASAGAAAACRARCWSIGYLTDTNQFVVCRADVGARRPDQSAAVTQRCQQLPAMRCHADGGGNGSAYNPLLITFLPEIVGLHAILYSTGDHAPRQHQGRLWHWTVGRTPNLRCWTCRAWPTSTPWSRFWTGQTWQLRTVRLLR